MHNCMRTSCGTPSTRNTSNSTGTMTAAAADPEQPGEDPGDDPGGHHRRREPDQFAGRHSHGPSELPRLCRHARDAD